MKKSVLVLMTVLGMMLATASPALAAFLQEGGAVSSGSAAEGTPPLPYELQKDGTLLIGGDVAISCPYEFGVAEQYAGTRPSDPELRANLEQNAEAVRLCEEKGFSPSGETAPVGSTDEAVAGNGASNVASSRDTTAPAQDGTSEGSVPVDVPVYEDATLPATGGGVPPTLLGGTGVLLLLLLAVGFLPSSRGVPRRRN